MSKRLLSLIAGIAFATGLGVTGAEARHWDRGRWIDDDDGRVMRRFAGGPRACNFSSTYRDAGGILRWCGSGRRVNRGMRPFRPLQRILGQDCFINRWGERVCR